METERKRARACAARLSCLAFFAIAFATMSSANAYTGEIHKRIGDQAFETLNLVRRGQFLTDVISRQAGQSVPALTALPADLPLSQLANWNRYIADVAAAAGKLELLLSDLPDSPNPTAQCKNAFPSGTPLRACRAGELPFVPDRYFGDVNSTACNFVQQYYTGSNQTPEFYQGVQHTLAGGLFGMYATKPDDFVDDTDVFMDPINVLGLGALNNASAESFDVGVAMFLLPFAIAIDLFNGGNPLDDALRDAHNLDPIPYLDTLVPGIPGTDKTGSVAGVLLAGMWHFMNVQFPTGQFNDTPGLRFDTGGFAGGIDTLDALIVVGTDFTGYTVNPDKSAGTVKYPPFADGPESRRKGDWLYGLAHTEFEPIHNLAQYAVNVSVNTGRGDSGASGIGWALHALGDASCPQHTISSPGWGHAVYEGFAADFWEETQGQASVGNQGQTNNVQRYFDFLKILEAGFGYWMFMDDIQQTRGTQAVPIRDLVVKVGNDTFAVAVNGNMFIPAISLLYVGEVAAGEKSLQRDTELGEYGSSLGRAQLLIQQSTGAGVAFLAKVAHNANDSTPTMANDPCFCQPGNALVGVDLAGVPVSSPTCKPCGQDPFANLPVSLDGTCVAACPSDKPFNQNGVCVAVCSTGSCPGTACPAETPFVSQGQCVSTCPPAQ